MRACVKCGGSVYAEYAYGCEHDYGEPPRPLVELVPDPWRPGEHVYMASHNGAPPRVWHPTEAGAVEAWRAAWSARETRTASRGLPADLRARLRLDVDGEPVTIASGVGTYLGKVGDTHMVAVGGLYETLIVHHAKASTEATLLARELRAAKERAEP